MGNESSLGHGEWLSDLLCPLMTNFLIQEDLVNLVQSGEKKELLMGYTFQVEGQWLMIRFNGCLWGILKIFGHTPYLSKMPAVQYIMMHIS